MEILAYQKALDSIQSLISQRKWDDLASKTQQLNMAKDKLQCYLQHSEINDVLRHKLEQLSIKHRRVVRQLSEQMQQTESDLNSVDEGLRHLHRVQELSNSV